MNPQSRPCWMLALLVAVISGFAGMLMSDSVISFVVYVAVSVGTASVIGIIRPTRVWPHATIASLGTPVVFMMRMGYNIASGAVVSSTAPIGMVFSAILGFMVCFSGVALGIGLRVVLEKLGLARSEWKIPGRARIVIIGFLIGGLLSMTVYLVTMVNPSPFPEFGVHLGKDFLHKKVIFAKSEIGDITAIRAFRSDSTTETRIVIVGVVGAMVLSQEFEVLSTTKFRGRYFGIEPVDVEGDGVYEFMNTGGGYQPFSLIGADGTILWTYAPVSGTEDMTAIDLNNDGIKEFVAGFRSGGGLRAVDRYGKELWSEAALDVYSVAAADVDDDGFDEIIHTDGDEIVIRSADGRKIRSLKLPFTGFTVGTWEPFCPHPVLFGMNDSSMLAYDFHGEQVGALPLDKRGQRLALSSLDLGGPGDPYPAVALLIRGGRTRSDIRVYDFKDSLVYREVIPAISPAMETIDDPNGDGQFLLVGGTKGMLLRYGK